ncbi:MAG: BrnT family toxin [Chloroflexi bacterium]|nr:BrnT family toxin [Chloroflexota bacterium]
MEDIIGRILVAHTEREDGIRIISARKAVKNEEKFYNETG